MGDDLTIVAEMQFGREGRPLEFRAEAHTSGDVLVEVGDDVGSLTYGMTLGQAVQLRDFLNRHIDELALKQTGSLAVRSSDDPNQLAAVEEVPVEKGCRRKLAPGRYFQFCGETDMGQTKPALCEQCGGDYELFDEDEHRI